MRKKILSEMDLSAGILLEALAESLVLAGRPHAVMFSGGFDSAFLYEQARKVNSSVVAVTVAFDRYNQHTVSDAVRLAGCIHARHLIVHVSLKEYLFSSARVHSLLKGDYSDHDLPLLYALLDKIPSKFKCFWAGMGSDQWLGDECIQRVSVKERLKASSAMVKQHALIAKYFGRGIFFPFLQAPVLKVAEKIPSALKKNKKLLRSLAPEISVLCSAGGSAELQVPLSVRVLAARYIKGKGAQ